MPTATYLASSAPWSSSLKARVRSSEAPTPPEVGDVLVADEDRGGIDDHGLMVGGSQRMSAAPIVSTRTW
jgi:hypothetical protein